VLGLLTALAGKRPLLYAWTGLFVLLSIAGLADFWKWGYDYGHNLDPTAAIRVPGMAYQPPLIGAKQLLNFYATSWPAAGGWALILSLGIGVGLCVLERRSRRGLTLALLLAACGEPGPVPIAWGERECDYCT